MNAIKGIFTNKCPSCGEGKIFIKTGFFNLRLPKMHSHCSNCNLKYEKEVGFFWGAMFVSYALLVAEIITFIVASKVLFNTTLDNTMIWLIVLGILLTSKFNFKLSRVIWIYLFPAKRE